MQNLVVKKYGGTSAATAHSFRLMSTQVETAIKGGESPVVVVSAPGKVNDRNDPEKILPRDLPKVTDLLIKLAANPSEENIAQLERRFRVIEEGLNLGANVNEAEYREKIAQRTSLNRGVNPVAALGEEWNAYLLARHLRAIGINAQFIDPTEAGLVFEKRNGVNEVNESLYPIIRRTIEALVSEGVVPVIPGFYSRDAQGNVDVFNRGGSDKSAAIIAAAIGARFDMYTDIDGIKVVEPEIAKNAPKIERMSARALSELTLGGAFGVVMHEATIPLLRRGVTMRVLDTFDSNGSGTLVLPTVDANEREITGIVARGDYHQITVRSARSANVQAYIARVAGEFAAAGISIEGVSSSVNETTVLVKAASMKDARIASNELCQRLSAEFDTDVPVTERRGNLVALVGEGVNTGTMRRVFGALDRAHLEPQSFQKQGITTILEFVNGAAKDAAQAIYREFFE